MEFRYYTEYLTMYPQRFKPGVLSNNPPAHDLLPTAKDLPPQHGVGKASP